MEYVLTFHILNVYVHKTQPHQFKFTFKLRQFYRKSQRVAQVSYCPTIIKQQLKNCLTRYKQ